jgi:hypothetical protein
MGPRGVSFLADRTLYLDEATNGLLVALLEDAVAQRALRRLGQRCAKFHGPRPG